MWQPIATAQQDGGSILVWDGQKVDMAHWTTFWGEGSWVIDYTDRGIKPTHWMPLPEPPTDQ